MSHSIFTLSQRTFSKYGKTDAHRWIKLLTQEHTRICKVIDATRILLPKFKAHNKNTDLIKDLETIIEINKNYKQKIHSEKEDTILIEIIQKERKLWQGYINALNKEHGRMHDNLVLLNKDHSWIMNYNLNHLDEILTHFEFEEHFVFPFIKHSASIDVNMNISNEMEMYNINNNQLILEQLNLIDYIIKKYVDSDWIDAETKLK